MRKQTVDMPSPIGPQGFHGLAETIAAPLTASVSTLVKGGRLSIDTEDVRKVWSASLYFEILRELNQQIEKDQKEVKMFGPEIDAQIVLFFAILGFFFSCYMVFDVVRGFIRRALK